MRGCVAGFPCKSVAACKQGRSDAAQAIDHGSGVAGSVFKIIDEFNQRNCSNIDFEILENVVGLGARPKGGGPSNLDVTVNKTSARLNAYSVVLALDPFNLQWDVHRPRFYMCFVAWRLLADLLPVTLDAVAQVCLDVAHAKPFGFSLRDILLPESHADVVNYLDGCRLQAPTSAKTQRHPNRNTIDAKSRRVGGLNPGSDSDSSESVHGLTWAQQNLDFCNETGQTWWKPVVPDAATMEAHPGLKNITLRQYDLLAFKARVQSFPEAVPRTCDLSQNIKRMGVDSACKTLTENSEVYLSHLCRMVVPRETIHMQGAHFGDRHAEVSDIDPRVTRRISGNAFHVWPATVAVLTTIVLMSEGRAARLRLAVASAAREEPGEKVLEHVTPSAPAPTKSDDIFDLLWANDLAQ